MSAYILGTLYTVEEEGHQDRPHLRESYYCSNLMQTLSVHYRVQSFQVHTGREDGDTAMIQNTHIYVGSLPCTKLQLYMTSTA